MANNLYGKQKVEGLRDVGAPSDVRVYNKDGVLIRIEPAFPPLTKRQHRNIRRGLPDGTGIK